jgi:hypothetical protein
MVSKKEIKSPYQLNPIVVKQIDNLVEIKKKELKRQKLASKLRKICEKAGNYAFILFDADTAPKQGDSMEVMGMKAVWRKIKK